MVVAQVKTLGQLLCIADGLPEQRQARNQIIVVYIDYKLISMSLVANVATLAL